MDKGLKMWSVVNKHHFLEHMMEQAEFENPIMYQVYSGEDFVGRISRLGHMCLPGNPTHTITTLLTERYLIGLHLRLTRLDNSASF